MAGRAFQAASFFRFAPFFRSFATPRSQHKPTRFGCHGVGGKWKFGSPVAFSASRRAHVADSRRDSFKTVVCAYLQTVFAQLLYGHGTADLL